MYIVTGDSSGYQTQPDESVTLDEAKGFIALLDHPEKFTVEEVIQTPGLEEYALAYVREYRGDFEFMRSMQHDYGRFGDLTAPKIKGVLNCLKAEVARGVRHNPDPAPEFDELGNEIEAPVQYIARGESTGTSYVPYGQKWMLDVAAGRYCLLDERARNGHAFYQVDRPTEGKWKGHVFVKRLLHTGSQERVSGFERDFILGQIHKDPDSMARYGHRTGHCGRCSRLLTDPESVALGIGPICREALG